jgi:hypothetical protein
MIVDCDVRKDAELVTVEGIYFKTVIDKSTYDGVDRFELAISVLTPDSPSTNNSITVKCKDLSLKEYFDKTFDFGSKIKLRTLQTAYQNRITHRLYEIVED